MGPRVVTRGRREDILELVARRDVLQWGRGLLPAEGGVSVIRGYAVV